MVEPGFKLIFCDIYAENRDAGQADFQVRWKSREDSIAGAQGSLTPLNDLPFAHKSFVVVNMEPAIDLPVNYLVLSGLGSFDLLFIPVKLWCITNFFSNRSFKLWKAKRFCGNVLNSWIIQ